MTIFLANTFLLSQNLFDDLSTSNPNVLKQILDYFFANVDQINKLFANMLQVRDQWLPFFATNNPDDLLSHCNTSLQQIATLHINQLESCLNK